MTITSRASLLRTVELEMTALLSSSRSCRASGENSSSSPPGCPDFSRLATKLGFCTISAKWRAFSKISRLRGDSVATSWAHELGDRRVVVGVGVGVAGWSGSVMARLLGRWDE